LLVFWGGKTAREEEGMIGTVAVSNAGRCGLAMMDVLPKVINKIILDKNLGNEISIGVGITFDSVIVTKIGIPNSYDVKAFGDCINIASKYSNNYNKIKVSKKVKDMWPSSKNGKLHFKLDSGGYFVE
jgi:adenylate cyclase